MFSIIRASLSLMNEIRDIINSNYHLYKDFLLIPKDHSEHFVNEQWVEKNFQIREFYIARDKGIYVGMASYQNLGNFAYIGYFYIRFGMHQQGYGNRLMQFLEMRTKSAGLTDIRLFVNNSADWAQKAYKSMGFNLLSDNKKEILSLEQGIFKNYYEEDISLLQKILSPLKNVEFISNLNANLKK